MTGKSKTIGIVIVVIFALMAAIPLFRPTDRGGGYDGYFSALNNVLKEAGVAQPAIVLRPRPRRFEHRQGAESRQGTAGVPDRNQVHCHPLIFFYT